MSPAREAAPAPRSILVIRLSALGDVVMASGLIPALRARWPQARLAWLVEPAAAPLLAHNPRIDEVIVWPRGEWRALARAGRFIALARRVGAFRRTLRAHRFDLVLDAQGLLKSGVMAWLTGAPRRVSLIGREGSHVLATERVVPPVGEAVPARPIGAEYRHLAQHLGAPVESFRLDLAVGDSARRALRNKLAAALAATADARDASIPLQRKRNGEPSATVPAYAALCPFTTRPQKHWFEDRWQALARRCLQAGLTPVLLGGPGDKAAAARIVSGVPGLVDLAGALALDESVAAIADAALVVGVDTGLTHMGTALAVPTVALFGSTMPYLDAGTPLTTVLYAHLFCSPCRRHPTCDGRYDCMRAFEAERVFAAGEALMSRRA